MDLLNSYDPVVSLLHKFTTNEKNTAGSAFPRLKSLVSSSRDDDHGSDIIHERNLWSIQDDLALLSQQDDEVHLQDEEENLQKYDHQHGSERDDDEIRDDVDDQVEERLRQRRLKTAVLKCCAAIDSNALALAYSHVCDLRDSTASSSSGSGIQRLAHYFAEALVARITSTGPIFSISHSHQSMSIQELLEIFGKTAESHPGCGIAVFVTNQIILDETSSASAIHVIDFGVGPGFRWLCLIKDLADRPGGPPRLRITAVESQQDSLFVASDAVGGALRRYAARQGVPFEFHLVVSSSWETIAPAELQSFHDETAGDRDAGGEVLVIASFYKLRKLRDEQQWQLLRTIRGMRPKLFLNAAFPPVSISSASLETRAREALDYYPALFGAIEWSAREGSLPARERLFMESLRASELMNLMACEGEDRVERPKGYRQWQALMRETGFRSYAIKNHVYSGAKRMLETYAGWRTHSIMRRENWLLFRWKGKLLIAISCWKS